MKNLLISLAIVSAGTSKVFGQDYKTDSTAVQTYHESEPVLVEAMAGDKW